MTTRRCPECRRQFAPVVGRQVYCARRCQQAGQGKGRRVYALPAFGTGGTIPNSGEWAVVVELPVNYADGVLPWLHGQYPTEESGRAAAADLAGRGVSGVRLERWWSSGRSGDRLGEVVAERF